MKKLLLFLSLALLMVSFTSCNKESEKNILGSWRLMHDQEIFDDSEYGYESEDYFLNDEKCYYLFQKNGVLFLGDEGVYVSWEYKEQSNEIIIAGRYNYHIEKFSHKEMVLTYTYTESEPDYWYNYTRRLYFEREKAPKGYGENVE